MSEAAVALTVSEFIAKINEQLAGEYAVEGEVAQFQVSQGKWIFFDLKDAQSVVRCFSTVFWVRAPIADGMRVRVFGHSSLHDKSGRFSFTVQAVELLGAGALELQYRLLKERLTQEGLFAIERKRALPRFPHTIGVITSRDAAAWGDFQRVLRNRWNGVEILLQHVRVQGEGAVEDIVSAFHTFNTLPQKPEVVVLIRGGGSLEDLAAFNSELVVRAVYGSAVPVVCGVGHERDETLADFAADRRASTPSNAAEIVVPNQQDTIAELDFTITHLVQMYEHELVRRRAEVQENALRLTHNVEQTLASIRTVIADFAHTVHNFLGIVRERGEAVRASARVLASVDPRQVLARGYSIVRGENGRVLTRIADLDNGATVMVELATGMFDSVVKKIYERKSKKK